MHPRVAFFLVAAVPVGFTVIGLANLLRWTSGVGETVSAVVLFAVCFGLQAFHGNPYTGRTRRKYGRWTLIAQACMTFALLPLAGMLSGTMVGFLAGSLLIVLSGTGVAWCLYVLLNVVLLLEGRVERVGPAPLYLTLSSLALGLIMYGLSQMGDLVIAQYRARSQAAWIAVSSERLRFARDLHDLLGYSLSAITLKNELVLRLVGSNDERARAELGETLTIARQALADVRAVVSGYRATSLAQEIELVGGVLDAAEVKVTVEGVPETLEPRTSTLLATVLREAVTNMLRHSQATRCRIVLDQTAGRTALTVSNDGIRDPHEASYVRRRGSGLDNVTARMAAVDGAVTILVCGEWFHLRAECPADPALSRARDRQGKSPGVCA